MNQSNTQPHGTSPTSRRPSTSRRLARKAVLTDMLHRKKEQALAKQQPIDPIVAPVAEEVTPAVPEAVAPVIVEAQIVPPAPSSAMTSLKARASDKVAGVFERVAASVKEQVRAHKPAILTGLVIFVVMLSGYVGIDTWLTNNRVAAYGDFKPDAHVVQTDRETQSEEGTDEAEVPSIDVDGYLVAPDLPRALRVDSLNIYARILPMGVNPDGSVQAPKNIFDSGWYTGSAKPGEAGASFIDAHASGATRSGLFAYLDKLKTGDIVKVEKGDGTLLQYKVTFVETVKKDEIDMSKVLQVYGGAEKGLNLMTCTGAWVKDQATYDKRVIVYTEQL